MKVKIIKKNDDYSLEYAIGDEFEVTGTWYGGVHISGKTGVPVSLDRDEYEEVPEMIAAENAGIIEENGSDKTERVANGPSAGGPSADESSAENTSAGNASSEWEQPDDPTIDPHGITVGAIVQHFKRESVPAESTEYLYKILAFAHHTENGEKLVIYQGMYPPFKICARPYAMFMSEVDRNKYPDVKQKYRFELYQE